MSRILLTWELGMNLGHLARLLPVAQKLKKRGHAVLVAARDLAAAATVLGPAGIPFVQAPHLPQGIPLPHRATGYADILLSQGWANRETLWGLTHGWINLYRMFQPEVLVLDYSPTARLTAHIVGIPCVLIGNGFELPPATNPLPAFPNFSWATQDKATESERIAISNSNAVARSFKKTGLQALCDLLTGQAVVYATFPELDHYGRRENAIYVGPLLGKLSVERVEWPEYPGQRIFVCLRADTRNVDAILGGLAVSRTSVVCFASGISGDRLEQFRRPGIRFVSRPVDLSHLAKNADLCLSYAAEGTMATFLLAGVPQLISPWQVEAHLAARRFEALGVAGIVLDTRSPGKVSNLLHRILDATEFKQAATRLRMKWGGWTAAHSIDLISGMIEEALKVCCIG